MNGDSTGQIIDLAEEKIYDLDIKKKTYKVTTFAELRKQMEEAKREAEKTAKTSARPARRAVEAGGEGSQREGNAKSTSTSRTRPRRAAINGFNTTKSRDDDHGA